MTAGDSFGSPVDGGRPGDMPSILPVATRIERGISTRNHSRMIRLTDDGAQSHAVDTHAGVMLNCSSSCGHNHIHHPSAPHSAVWFVYRADVGCDCNSPTDSASATPRSEA
jgi:hypothetical protein